MLPLFYYIEYIFFYLYILIVQCHSCCPQGFRSVEGLLWGAEPRFELGPPIQHADALLSESSRTLEIGLLQRNTAHSLKQKY
jgi:hypothetical protein